MIEPFPFDRQKPGRILVLSRPREIYFLVRGVDIAAENDGAALSAQGFDVVQEVGIVLHFVRHAAVVTAAIREIGVDENEVPIVSYDGAPLAIVVCHAETGLNGERLSFGEQGCATISGALGRCPECVVSGWFSQIVSNLIRPAFRLLQGDDVGLRGRQPLKKNALAMERAQAVDVPTVESHHGSHSSTIARRGKVVQPGDCWDLPIRLQSSVMSNSVNQPLNLYDLTRSALSELLASWGYSDYYAGLVWSGLYRELAEKVADIAGLRVDIAGRLAAETVVGVLSTRSVVDSADGHTQKFLLGLADGQAIETVLMYFRGRATACVSTQVGCAMGCIFCATGQMGFRRHLAPGEIVAQVVHVARVLRRRGESLRNIVLMGMGEPLHNYDATMAAMETVMDHRGLAIAPRFITLSTVGVVPGIRRLAEERRPIRLAVSLHGATDEERSRLVPPARRWPLSELIDVCQEYSRTLGRRIFFEWALIDGENDGPEQAHALGRLLQGLDAHVNLIPLNPTIGYDGRPTEPAAVKAFQAILAEYGLPSTVRQRRGIDVAAGCGQLATLNPTA